MSKGLSLLSSLVLAALIASPSWSEEGPSADTVVATVNGEEITIGHMIIARATLPEQYQQFPPEVLYEGILDQLIQQTALSQSQGDAMPPQVALSLENERRSLMAAEAIEKVMADAVTDAGIQAAYEAQYADPDQGEEYRASHILVETEEEAQAIKTALNEGADFAEQAQEKSTGPSGPRGGDLGWFGPGMMVPEFEAAVTALEPGTVSEPVQTQFGWHLILLAETRLKEAPVLDLVREELTAKLQRDAVEAHVRSLTEAATVERPEVEGLEPGILEQLDIIGN